MEASSDSPDDFVDAIADVYANIIPTGDLSDPGGTFDPTPPPPGGDAEFDFVAFLEAFAIDEVDADDADGSFAFSITLDPGEYLDIYSATFDVGTVNGDLIPIPVGPAAPPAAWRARILRPLAPSQVRLAPANHTIRRIVPVLAN